MIAVKRARKLAWVPVVPFAAWAEAGHAVLDFVQVQHEVVGPETGPLAHRRRLGRLEMGERQAGQVAVLPGEGGQGVDHARQPVADQRKRSRSRIRSVLSVT